MNGAFKKIGAFFKAHRLEAQIDPDQVAVDLGLTTTTLFQYEEGSSQIPLEDVFAMANLYNISPDIVVKFLYDLSVNEISSKELKAN